MMHEKLMREIIVKANSNRRFFLSPHPLLKRYISHYSFYFGKEKPDYKSKPLFIIPDASGCIVFKFKENMIQNLLWGPTKEVKEVENDLSGTFYFFVEFLPGGLKGLTGIDLNELTDKILNLEEVNSKVNLSIIETFESKKNINSFKLKIDEIFIDFMMIFLALIQ